MRRTAWLATVIALALAATSCASAGDVGAGTTTTGSQDTTTSGPMDMEGIHIAESDLGSILVDGDGFTLYVFTNDSAGESTCNEGCASTWPPVPASSEIASGLDGGMFGTTTRSDGTDQLTVNGQPVYRYAPDPGPGDTNGQGIGGVWFVVDSSGQIVSGQATGSATSTTSDYGRDY